MGPARWRQTLWKARIGLGPPSSSAPRTAMTGRPAQSTTTWSPGPRRRDAWVSRCQPRPKTVPRSSVTVAGSQYQRAGSASVASVLVVGRAGGGCGCARPAAVAALVLLLQPLLQRREVLEHRGGVELLGTGQRLQRLLPRLRLAFGEHRLVLAARGFAAVEAALVQRALEAGGVAQRLVELELQHVREEVARVWSVARHVVLRARVEVVLAAGLHRGHALVLGLQVPP